MSPPLTPRAVSSTVAKRSLSNLAVIASDATMQYQSSITSNIEAAILTTKGSSDPVEATAILTTSLTPS
jgi:hypothetical protein